MSIQAIDVPSFYAERTPQAIALGDGDTGDVYTWADLHDRSARVARVLEDEFRVVAGDRVCVIADNVPQVFELQFACMRLGALFVPLNWRLAAAELLSIVQDADPALIVHDDTWDAAAIELVGKVGCGRLSWGDGSPAGGAGNGYERLLSAASPLRPRERDLGAYTHVLYTSGTTGMPKGSLSTHGTLHWHASNVAHGRAFGGRAFSRYRRAAVSGRFFGARDRGAAACAAPLHRVQTTGRAERNGVARIADRAGPTP